MIRVIELGRVAREKRALSLKNPLPEVIVVHNDPQVLEDISSLELYVTEELNVRKLICTSDEKKYNIKCRAEPEFKLLGQKFGELMKTATTEVAALSQDKIQQFLKDGFIDIPGLVRLEANEIKVIRYFESTEQAHLQANADSDLVIILNCDASDKSLVHEGIAREVVNRVQRLRKEVHLNATDDVITYFQVLEDNSNEIAHALSQTQEFVVKTLKRGVVPKQNFSSAKLITEKEVEVKGSKLVVFLVWP